MLAGRPTGHGKGSPAREAEDEPVLVGRPDLSVEAQEAGTSGFLTAESNRAIDQTGHETT